MKSQTIATRSGLTMLLIIMVIALAGFGCSESLDPVSLEPETTYESTRSGNIITESFRVEPEGTIYSALGGKVRLNFPDGAVTEPTFFTVASFPLDHLDIGEFKTMNRGISLQGMTTERNFGQQVKIRLTYDVSGFKGGATVDESRLTIYNLYGNYQAYKNITSIGNCCTDLSCSTISGCIGTCGIYVVGEK